MDSEQKFWLLFWVIFGTVVILTAWAIAWGTTVTSREAIEKGYVETEYTYQQYTGKKWVKP